MSDVVRCNACYLRCKNGNAAFLWSQIKKYTRKTEMSKRYKELNVSTGFSPTLALCLCGERTRVEMMSNR